jgi:hypothetical protein
LPPLAGIEAFQTHRRVKDDAIAGHMIASPRSDPLFLDKRSASLANGFRERLMRLPKSLRPENGQTRRFERNADH